MSPVATDEPVDSIVRDQLAAERARQTDRSEALVGGLRAVVVFSLFLVVLGLIYSGYKWAGTTIDDGQTEWPLVGSFLPATDDLRMPPILDIVAEFGEPLQRASDKPLWEFIVEAAAFTFREAAVGFVAGVVIGLAVALVLARSALLERSLLPWVIISQTIPLIAIAPIIIIWGRNNFDFLPFEWQDWMSVSLIATFLSFFPVAVNGLRGLQSPSIADLELMDSYAASWWRTTTKLRLPASLPYLFPAFRLAATASVVGAIVGEISAGVDGGLGRLILDFASRYTTGPERLYAAVIGAALLGLFVVGVIALVERIVLASRGQSAVAT